MKFNRTCRVEFAGADVQPVSDLRVQFDIDKADQDTMNHAHISIFNLSESARRQTARATPVDPDGRARLVEPVIGVRLFAGYRDGSEFLFGGDVLWCTHEKVGPDWVTKIEAWTALREAMRPSQVSFATETPARTVLEAILEPLALSVGYTDEAKTILADKIVNDFSASGLGVREADEFLSRYGLSFTIEEQGQGLVYAPRQARSESAKTDDNTFSPATGLLGAPTVLSFGVELRSLLRPNLKLFDRIFVDSATTSASLHASGYSAEYFVKHLSHHGDTHGDDWHTEIAAYYAKFAEGVIAT